MRSAPAGLVLAAMALGPVYAAHAQSTPGWRIEPDPVHVGEPITLTWTPTLAPAAAPKLVRDGDAHVELLDAALSPDGTSIVVHAIPWRAGAVRVEFPAGAGLPPLDLAVASVLPDPLPEELPYGLRDRAILPTGRNLLPWAAALAALIAGALWAMWVLRRKRRKPAGMSRDPWQEWRERLLVLEKRALPDRDWVALLMESARDGLALVEDLPLHASTAGEIRLFLEERGGSPDFRTFLGIADRVQFGGARLPGGSHAKLVRVVEETVMARRQSVQEPAHA